MTLYSQYRLNAIQIIQEVSLRLGITRPLSIENPSGSIATIEDKDAELLKGALNQSLRMATSAFTWKELIRYCEVQVPAFASGEDHPTLDLNDICAGYDGIVSNAIFAKAADSSHYRVLKLLTLDKFIMASMSKWVEEEDWAYDKRVEYGYIINGEDLFLTANTVGYVIQFSYKTRLPVVRFHNDGKSAVAPTGKLNDNYSLRPIFEFDDDWSPIDDEALILGTIIGYKNYVGRDFQLELKLFTEYIEHMKERTGGLTVIEENMYRTLAEKMHRYPPSNPMNSGGVQSQKPPQQQQQNPRGQ